MGEIIGISENQSRYIEPEEDQSHKVEGKVQSTVLKSEEKVDTDVARRQALLAELSEIATKISSLPNVNANILNRIIRLLTELLPILQHIGTAQAAHLSLPTKMQALYTELIAKAPVYTKAQISDDKDRDAKNQQIGIYVDRLRSYRELWADYAKKVQSNIGTTQENTTAQIDLLVTFLQQLRELVSLVTR